MNTTSSSHIIQDGLWRNNIGLVQLLGLCPLLAVSTTVVNGLGLGLATMFVLVLSNTSVALIRKLLLPEIRIAAFVLIIAALVTAVELLMNAFFHELHKVLGIFIPLIVTNCAIIGRAEAFASRQPISKAFLDGFMMGAGFAGVLVALGLLREILGRGSIFAYAHMMFGDTARDWTLQLFDGGFLLAVLPPGAFIGLGLLIALKNVIDRRQTEARGIVVEDASAGAHAG